MPDVSLNGIEFQIKGSSDKASNSIDSLIKNLNSLKSALAATNSVAKGTGTFKELAVSIKDFNDALKGGSERYKKFAQGLEDIAAAAELLGEKTQHISDLATSMEKLSNSKISGAAFKNLADGMAAVGFATKFISKEALDNLERMATSLSKLAGVDLKGLGSAMNAVGRGKTLEPPSPVPSEIQDVINSGDQIDLLRLKLGELQTALQSAFEKGDLTGAIRIRQQIASVEAEIRKLEEAANEVVPTMGRFREALSSIGSFLGKCAGTAEKVFSAFGKVLAFPFTRAAKDIGGYAKSIWGVVSGFKRIVGYRLIRSIIREVTQAFSEGIKNLYGWSKAMGGATIGGKNFAQTMDGLATSSLYFKNSIGAMVAPIISALAPAIDYIIDKVVALINVINQLMALLGGATSWNKAIRKASEFEDAAGGAGGAAKEALRYLAPFDELNRLPDDNKGGGGGGSGDDYSGMFEEQTEFLEGLKDFADSIRAAIDAGDWEGLGVLLGDKVNELIEKIDFASLGTKVGEKINALFTTEYWTLNTINFQNIGKKIAEFLTGENGIGGALREIDFSNIGGIMAEKLTALPEVLIGVVNNLDFSVVGKSLGDIIKGFANDMADQINKIDWGTTLRNIVTGIVDFIKGLDINGIVESILKLTGSIIGAVIEGIGPLLVDLADTLTSPDTWTLVTAWLADLPAKMKQAGISAINALADPIIDGLNSLIEKINSSGLAKALGIEVEPIEFKLIPDIPKEELTKNYDKAKAEIEAQSKKKPTNVDTTANFTNWKKSDKWKNGGDYWNTIPIGARFNDWKKDDKWKNGGDTWNTIAIGARFNDWKKDNKWKNGGDSWNTIKMGANFNTWSNNLGTPSISAVAAFASYSIARAISNGANQIVLSAVASIVGTQGGKALGGSYYGGAWHSIPQYASGGRPHGTMFWAGEAGPEVVGHVGGRTEVLNQSQLAATMYASVSAALSGLRFAMTAPATPDGGMGGSDDALYNAFVRALESADFAVDNTINMDGDTVYRGVVRRNQQRRRQLGYNPMLT